MGKATTTAKNKYNDKAYDRISLSVPKGKKDQYREEAEKRGMSLNNFIMQALEKEMSGILEEIKDSVDMSYEAICKAEDSVIITWPNGDFYRQAFIDLCDDIKEILANQ